MNTVTGRVTRVEPLGHSVYGNPYFEVGIEAPDGHDYRIRTSIDASINYEIRNYLSDGKLYTFHLTKAERIMFARKTQPVITGSVEVCIDCVMKAENDIDSPSSLTPWEFFAEYPAELFPTADFDTETEQGMTEFSSTPCGACGSHLAGARFTYATWGYPADTKAVSA